MNTPKLPPLPDAGIFDNEIRVWTTEQMQAYAIAAIEAQGVPDGVVLQIDAAVVQQEPTKIPGMAVQALAGEIIEALLLDEKEGGYDLTAGMFGSHFSTLVRRWATAEFMMQAKPQPLSDEQDRALCEAYFNTASDEYFNARPHLDSAENRRIFYAGHRKAWIEWQAAHTASKGE